MSRRPIDPVFLQNVRKLGVDDTLLYWLKTPADKNRYLKVLGNLKQTEGLHFRTVRFESKLYVIRVE